MLKQLGEMIEDKSYHEIVQQVSAVLASLDSLISCSTYRV